MTLVPFNATIGVMNTKQSISPIKAFRESKGMRQQDFGALFNPPFGKTSVHRWEVDGVPLERVLEIEKVTGIPRTELAPEFFAPVEMKRAVGQ